MNRLFWLVLGLALVTSPGCMMMPKSWREARGTKSEVEPLPPPRVVVKEEVTEANYPREIDALREELDYAANHPPRQITVHSVDGVK